MFRWKVELDDEIDKLKHTVIASHVSQIADISSLEIVSTERYAFHTFSVVFNLLVFLKGTSWC